MSRSMTWLMLAKMPLLMSSRMMSAALTPRSSASSLTVIEDGISTAPREPTDRSSGPAPLVRHRGDAAACGGRACCACRCDYEPCRTSVERHEVAVLEPLAQLGGEW